MKTSKNKYEFAQAMNKKMEADILNQQSMENKKNMQTLLAQDYENAMRLKKLQKENEKSQSLMAGKVSNQKAELELNYLRKAENDKKKMIQEILTSEKTSFDDRKRKMQSQSYTMDRAEAQKLMAENEKREAYKDYMNSQKYNNFNNFQTQANNTYREQVAKPEMEKRAKLDQIIKKQENEVRRRENAMAEYKEKTHLNMRMNNRSGIEKQMRDKRTGRIAGQTEFQVDLRDRLTHEK